MLQEAIDFYEESDALYALLDGLNENEWKWKTQFKEWTINDVIAHLHFGNYAADLSLKGADAFTQFTRQLSAAGARGIKHKEFTHAWLEGISGLALANRWRPFYGELAQRFGVADPKRRVQWFGPSMSVRTSVTARLMETWAHGQAIYDLLGRERVNADRVKNIAVIGINTFGWTFANRGLQVPESRPYVRLTAPSGAVWEWGEADRDNAIEGGAVEFCQVVTQVRHVADTQLRVVGNIASAWMSIAQCFAGPPEEPPAPGRRRIQRRPEQVQ
jgi:uncharacterized protein (TIGR03084 family)